MADVKKKSVVMVYTTPDELRKLADEMEAFWRTCQWGQDVTVKKWIGDDVRVHIACDQYNMPSNEHGLGRDR